MRYSQQLDDEFKKLGFLNFKQFIRTAAPEDSDNTGVANRYLMDDLYTDPDDIGYIFTVKQNADSEKWQIESINAAYQMHTERNIEGVIVIGKTIYPSKGIILTKEDLRKEILEAVRIEKIKEKFYCSQNKGNTVYKRFRM